MQFKERYLFLMYFLLAMIFGSSILLVNGANAMRESNQYVGLLHEQYDDELENYSRLRLELGALTSLSRVESIAVKELQMVFPDKIYGLVD